MAENEDKANVVKILLLAMVCSGMAIATSYIASEIVKEISKARPTQAAVRKAHG